MKVAYPIILFNNLLVGHNTRNGLEEVIVGMFYWENHIAKA